MSRTEKQHLWGDGPWVDEVDEVNWVTPVGYDACIKRHPGFGTLCGYVELPRSHPWWGVADKPMPARSAAEETTHLLTGERLHISDLVRVHGGVTFAAFDQGPNGLRWLVGFDCGHGDDLSPYLAKMFRSIHYNSNTEYRTVDYVKDQCERLAEQLYMLEMKVRSY